MIRQPVWRKRSLSFESLSAIHMSSIGMIMTHVVLKLQCHCRSCKMTLFCLSEEIQQLFPLDEDDDGDFFPHVLAWHLGCVAGQASPTDPPYKMA